MYPLGHFLLKKSGYIIYKYPPYFSLSIIPKIDFPPYRVYYTLGIDYILFQGIEFVFVLV